MDIRDRLPTSWQSVETEPVRVQSNGVGADSSTRSVYRFQRRDLTGTTTDILEGCGCESCTRETVLSRNQNPVGKHSKQSGRRKGPIQIVGVVPDMALADLQRDPPTSMFQRCKMNGPVA
jgi:hypothetical protein